MNNQLECYELQDLLIIEKQYLLYRATQKQSQQRVIIKIDSTKAADSIVRTEAYFLDQLKNVNGIIKVLDFGISKDNRFFIAVEPYSKNINKMLEKDNILPLQSILILGIKIITALEQIHRNGIIHRNINPETIYTKPDIQISNFCHAIKAGQNKPYFYGNKIFGSRNQNFQNMPTPQDDLESLGYLLIYLRNGSLPWMDNPDNCDEVIGKIKEDLYSKKSLQKNMPNGFNLYFTLIKDLRYQNIKSLFLQMMGGESDMKFQWVNLNFDQQNSITPLRVRDESAYTRPLTTIPEVISTLQSNCHLSKQFFSSKQLVSCKITGDLEGKSTMDVLDPLLEDSIEFKLKQLTTLDVKLKGKYQK